MAASSNLFRVAALLVALVLAACMTVLLADIRPAEATFPGENGRIAFTRILEPLDSEIFVMKADGSGRRNLTNNARDDGEPTWSVPLPGAPEGKIAFSSGGQESPAKIFVMNADGDEKKRLTRSRRDFDADPAFSPNGKKIVFSRLFGFEGGTLVMNVDGSGVRRISRNVGFALDWQPRP